MEPQDEGGGEGGLDGPPSAPLSSPPRCEEVVDIASLQSLSSFQWTSTMAESNDSIALLGTFLPSPAPAVLVVKPPRLSASALIDPLATTAISLRHSNSIYYSFTAPLLPCHVDVTYPAPARVISSLSSSNVLVTETSSSYLSIHLPHITSLLQSPTHLDWVWNIIEGRSEVDRVLFASPSSSPHPFTLVAHPEWDLRTTNAFHAIALFHDSTLRSLRDLTAEHLPMLAELRREVGRVVEDRLGVTESGVMLYLHYPPSYYLLHVHVVGVDVDKGFSSAVNKAVDLFEVEQQLRRDSSWYQTCEMRCRVKASHPLAQVKPNQL